MVSAPGEEQEDLEQEEVLGVVALEVVAMVVADLEVALGVLDLVLDLVGLGDSVHLFLLGVSMRSLLTRAFWNPYTWR